MAIVMPEEATFELAPPGAHIAVCFRVIDLGTQPGQYGPKQQVLFSWELPDEQADGRPAVVNRRYTLSSNSKAALRGAIEGWLGRTLTAADFGKFDLSQLVGSTCLIGLKHVTKDDGRVFADVTSVMRRPKAVPERLSCTNEAVTLSLADRPFRQFEYDQLPGWIKELVARSQEYAAATKPEIPLNVGTRKRLKAILADSPASRPEPVVEDLDDQIPDFP